MNNKYISDEVVHTYNDLDLNFTAHPVTGDIVLNSGLKALETALKHLVYYNYYEKPFHPEIGTGIYGSLFEHNLDRPSMILLKSKIISTINRYEPRATEIKVNIEKPESNNNSIFVSIFFVPENASDEINIEFFIHPVR